LSIEKKIGRSTGIELFIFNINHDFQSISHSRPIIFWNKKNILLVGICTLKAKTIKNKFS